MYTEDKNLRDSRLNTVKECLMTGQPSFFSKTRFRLHPSYFTVNRPNLYHLTLGRGRKRERWVFCQYTLSSFAEYSDCLSQGNQEFCLGSRHFLCSAFINMRCIQKCSISDLIHLSHLQKKSKKSDTLSGWSPPPPPITHTLTQTSTMLTMASSKSLSLNSEFANRPEH